MSQCSKPLGHRSLAQLEPWLNNGGWVRHESWTDFAIRLRGQGWEGWYGPYDGIREYLNMYPRLMLSQCWTAVDDPSVDTVPSKIAPYQGITYTFEQALKLVKEGYVLGLVGVCRTVTDYLNPKRSWNLIRLRHLTGTWEVVDYVGPP